MTSTRSSSTNAKTRSATRRIDSFRQRFGDGHFYLACHAALPLALTPDLLYSLWANFQRDTQGEAIEIPWIAVADLLLSNLCKEVGNELYEMDALIRNELLTQLQNDSRFGLERVRELADFVMAYVEHQLDNPDLDVRDLATGQQWRALAYKDPAEAAHNIASALAQLPLNDKAEWIRMAALTISLSEPLSAFQSLLDYTQAMATLARGNLETATVQMAKAVDTNNQVRVEGTNLPIPDAINGELPQSIEQDKPAISLPNWFVKPITIAGGIVISLLIVFAWVSQLIRPNRQATPLSSVTPSPRTSSSAPSTPQRSPSPSPTSSPSPSPTLPQSTQSPQTPPVISQSSVASQPRTASSPTSSPAPATTEARPNSNVQSSTTPPKPIELLPSSNQSSASQSSLPSPSLDERDRFVQPAPIPSPSPEPPLPTVASPSPEPPLPTVVPQTIPVVQIQVVGSTVLSPGDIQSIVQPLEGTTTSLEQLRVAADAITHVYLDRGYITSRAILSDQPITDGVIRIQVVEGSLERIDVEGTQNVDSNYIRQIVQRGASVPLNPDNLEAQLRILQSDPKFTNVKATLKPGTQVGQSILVVRVTEAVPSGEGASQAPSGIRFRPPQPNVAPRTEGGGRR